MEDEGITVEPDVADDVSEDGFPFGVHDGWCLMFQLCSLFLSILLVSAKCLRGFGESVVCRFHLESASRR